MLFELKRAYQAPLYRFNPLLVRHLLTCARFDLLIAVGFGRGAVQSDLWKRLGVSRPVVSRMLKALERLQLVERHVLEEDRRQRWVELTPFGRRFFKKVYNDRDLVSIVELGMDTAVDDWCFWSTGRREMLMSELEAKLHGIQMTFGDRSRCPYDWSLSDFYDEDAVPLDAATDEPLEWAHEQEEDEAPT